TVTDTICVRVAAGRPAATGTDLPREPPGNTPFSIAKGSPPVTVRTRVSGLTGNACDEASVVCDVVGASRQVQAKDDKICNTVVLGCRVTGGGIVDACGTGASGCDPNTPGSCAPDSCAELALNATH